MRLVHFSDTHLGYSEYGKIDPESGINRREEDFYRIFRDITKYIIRTKPNLVIHAGDLFDSIRPSNRAMGVALEQLMRLSTKCIPTVIIAGNHSTPRQKSTDSVFKILQYFPHIYPFFSGKYERRRIGDCTIHAIPHSYSDKDLQDSIKKLKADKRTKFNVMVAHAAILGVQEASWGEFKQQTIPRSALKEDFDYIALGHYHKYLKMKDNAYYCGSPEKIGFREAGNKNVFLDVRLGDFSVTPVPTNAREMVSIGPLDCKGLSASEIANEVERKAGAVDDKIVRIIFDNIPRHVRSSLDMKRIRQAMSGSLYWEPLYNYSNGAGRVASSKIGSIGEEFENYVRNLNLKPDEAEKVLSMGREYLGDAVEGQA